MEYFGKTKKGETVNKYILKSKDLEISILNYGGTITSIIMSDKNGNKSNIVCGFDTIEDYEEKSPEFGCIIGRTAGRIAYGKFTLNNKEYNMAINNGLNHLHGGLDSLNKKVWEAKQTENTLELSYFSKDGESEYPGNVNFKVTYELIENELSIRYFAETDQDTIINMTNHSYFNLSSGKEDCLNHELYINADKISTLHKDGFVSGNFMNVENTAFDFRKAKKIGKDINNKEEQIILGSGYDHPFILNSDKPQAKVYHAETGRIIELETDQKTLVFYTGNFLGKEGKLNWGSYSVSRGAFCLEAQNIPNHINIKGYDEIVTKEKPYYAETIFRFKLGSEKID